MLVKGAPRVAVVLSWDIDIPIMCPSRDLLYFIVVWCWHYGDVIVGAIASQITSLTIVYSFVYSGTDQRKHQSSASLVFVWGIHRGRVNSPHKWPVTRKMFPFDDVIMGPFIFSRFTSQTLNVLFRVLSLYLIMWYSGGFRYNTARCHRK